MQIENYADVPTNPKELVELLANVHLGISCNENSKICGSGGDVYDSSENLFKAMIAVAYQDVDHERIYEIWLGCNESVSYCVNWWSKFEKE